MRTKFISDDGKVESDDSTEVERYEAGLNPLAKFGFPWQATEIVNPEYSPGWIDGDGGLRTFRLYRHRATAFINLVPLIEELRKAWGAEVRRVEDAKRFTVAVQELLTAYEKALEESK